MIMHIPAQNYSFSNRIPLYMQLHDVPILLSFVFILQTICSPYRTNEAIPSITKESVSSV